jgi:hydroxymethylbilane synthase
MSRLRLGTRRSALAQAQSRAVAEALLTAHPGLRIELVLITTSGDVTSSVQTPQASMGGLKALFTKELEEALLAGSIDFAVHSMKDLPPELPRSLVVAAVPKREDARDVLVSRHGLRLRDLPPGARIGTSAVRRQAQLLLLRPDLQILPMRGNVDTRLRKLHDDELDAIVVASAGLKRLDRLHVITEILPEETVLPAPGQGALALETRIQDVATRRLLLSIHDGVAQLETSAERSFLQALGGSCQTPIAARAIWEPAQLQLTGLVIHPSGGPSFRATLSASRGAMLEPRDAEALGARLAEKLLSDGARSILG